MDKTSIPKELLSDPSYRIVKDIRPPVGEVLSQKKVFDSVTKKPIPENLKPHFLREGKLEKADALRIISLASPVFEREPNVLAVADPVTGMHTVNYHRFICIPLFQHVSSQRICLSPLPNDGTNIHYSLVFN
jgi:hypothetical protein